VEFKTLLRVVKSVTSFQCFAGLENRYEELLNYRPDCSGLCQPVQAIVVIEFHGVLSMPTFVRTEFQEVRMRIWSRGMEKEM
jgi:hypothetical protein